MSERNVYTDSKTFLNAPKAVIDIYSRFLQTNLQIDSNGDRSISNEQLNDVVFNALKLANQKQIGIFQKNFYAVDQTTGQPRHDQTEPFVLTKSQSNMLGRTSPDAITAQHMMALLQEYPAELFTGEIDIKTFNNTYRERITQAKSDLMNNIISKEDYIAIGNDKIMSYTPINISTEYKKRFDMSKDPSGSEIRQQKLRLVENELQSVTTEMFGSKSNVPSPYIELLTPYISDDDLNKLLNDFYAKSDERMVETQDGQVHKLSVLQAKRAKSILDTFEKKYKGMYRVKRHQTRTDEIVLESLDNNNVKVTLLPSRDTNRPTDEQLWSVGTVDLGNSLFSIADPKNSGKYGRLKDNVQIADIPGDVIMRATLLNSRNAEMKHRLDPSERVLMKPLRLNGSTSLKPEVVEDLQSGNSKFELDNSRGPGKINVVTMDSTGRVHSRKMSANEAITNGMGGNVMNSYQLAYTDKNNETKYVSMASIPMAPIDSIATNGLKSSIKAFSQAIQIDKSHDVINTMNDSKESEGIADIEDINDYSEFESNDFDFLDFLESDEFDLEFGALEDIDISAQVTNGIDQFDYAVELENRQNFKPSDENPIHKLDLKEDIDISNVATKEERHLLNVLQAMGIHPAITGIKRKDKLGIITSIESNAAKTVRVTLSPMFNGYVENAQPPLQITIPYAILQNFDQETGSYAITANGKVKGVAVPGQRMNLDIETGRPIAVPFDDIVEQNISRLVLDQLSNQAYATDSLDLYTRLDKLFTTDGYVSFYPDLNPGNLDDPTKPTTYSDDTKLILDKARTKCHFIKTISDSATTFNLLKKQTEQLYPNARKAFTSLESIRVPQFTLSNIFDLNIMDVSGENQFMGKGTYIDPDTGEIKNDEVPQVLLHGEPLPYNQTLELMAQSGDEDASRIWNSKRLDFPIALSKTIEANPTRAYDPQIRQAGYSQQETRLASDNQKTTAHIAYIPEGGFEIGDGYTVTKDWVEKQRITNHGNGETRLLKVGDKITDEHNNKGVINTIIDMDADYSNKPHRAILQEIIKANPNVDVLGSASSISKRMQGGLAHELVNNNLGNLVDPVIKTPEGYDYTVPLKNATVSEINMRISDMDVDYKTNIYTLLDYIETGKGRAMSSQLAAILSTSVHANDVLKEIYGSNDYGFSETFNVPIPNQDAILNNNQLVSDLNFLGYDINKDGVFGRIDAQALIDTDNVANGGSTLIKIPRINQSFKSLIAEATKNPNANRIALLLDANKEYNFHGIGDEEKVSSLVDYKDPSGRIIQKSVVMIPLAYLREITELGNEQQSLITTDAYRNKLQTVYNAAVGISKNPFKSTTDFRPFRDAYLDAANQLVHRDFGDNKHNLIKNSFMRNQLPNSATAVMTADPDLPLDTIAVSPKIYDNLAIDKNEPDARILVWRDPALRKYNAMGVKVIVDENLTGVAINPHSADIMDGDFDGDQLGMFSSKSEAFQTLLKTDFAAESFSRMTRNVSEITSRDPDGYVTGYKTKRITNIDMHGVFDITVKNIMDTLPEHPDGMSVEDYMSTLSDVDKSRYQVVLDIHKIGNPDELTEAEQETYTKDFEKLTARPESFGGVGINATSLDHVYDSIVDMAEKGYAGSLKTEIVDGKEVRYCKEAEGMRKHYNGEVTLAETNLEASGNGAKSDFIGLGGSLQHLIMARARATENLVTYDSSGKPRYDKSINPTMAKLMDIGMNITHGSTDGLAQAKHEPQRAKQIADLANKDLSNLLKGYDRNSGKKGYARNMYIHKEEWTNQMVDILMRDPLVDEQGRFGMGVDFDINDLKLMSELWSEPNTGLIRQIGNFDPNERHLSIDHELGAMDLIAYSKAMYGSSTKGFEVAARNNASFANNDLSNSYLLADRKTFSNSVMNTMTGESIISAFKSSEDIQKNITHQDKFNNTTDISDLGNIESRQTLSSVIEKTVPKLEEEIVLTSQEQVQKLLGDEPTQDTYSDLAKALSVTPQTIRKWNAGVTIPSNKSSERILDLYTVRVSDTLEDTQVMTLPESNNVPEVQEEVPEVQKPVNDYDDFTI